jgi:hypothetical protein
MPPGSEGPVILCAGHPGKATAIDTIVTWRQAGTKHFHVLETAGFVRYVKRGRESLFEFGPKVVLGMREHLETVSPQ